MIIDKIKKLFGIGTKNTADEVTVNTSAASKAKPTYVIIGASAAGVDAVKTIRKYDKDVNIVVVSKDEQIYSRCMLHHVISDHRTIEGINFVDADFMEKHNATWIKKATVTSIDTDNKVVKYEKDGKAEDLAYDKLLIAAGANAFIPPVKNLREGKNIYPLRNIEDAVAIKEKAKTAKKVAIMGAGLVGIDALAGLMDIDTIEELSLIVSNNRILDRQLDKRAARTYEEQFEAKGVKIYKECMASEVFLDKDNNITGVDLGNGTTLECELLIVSTGVKSNIDFLEGSGIKVDRGIVINSKCETNIPDVYAAGDVTGTGIWPLAVKQAIVAASTMVGVEAELDDDFQFRNTMNFMGIPTVSLGFMEPADDSYTVITQTDGENYKKAVIKDDVLIGYLAQGDISYIGPHNRLVRDKIKVENLASRVFEIGYSDFFSIKKDGQFEWNV